jgi:predicted dehydrogenase
MSSPVATLHRRKFLKLSAAAAGAITLPAPAAQARGANEKINIGLIGCGNRGGSLIREAMRLKHNLVAVCDVADFRYDKLFERIKADKDLADAFADADPPTRYADYRKLLDHKGLDAVIVATPDHHHRDQLIAAVQAEKDAYVEKPLTKSIDEGKEMIEEVRKAKRVVQVGNQRHSGPHWRRCRDVIQSDDFGELVWAKVWDCRNWVKKDHFAVPAWFGKEQQKQIDWKAFLGKAPDREFSAVRYWSWRWYWDYAGGLMTDIGAHQLDIVQWLGGMDAPKSVTANGGTYHFKHWETPDVLHGVWDYGRFAATFAVEFVNGADGVGAAFYGTKMTLIADAEKEVRVYDTIDKITPAVKPVDVWKVENETAMHVKNWLDCCKSRRDPNSPIELGHKVITAAHLANLSYRTGKKVYWDAEREQVIGI